MASQLSMIFLALLNQNFWQEYVRKTTTRKCCGEVGNTYGCPEQFNQLYYRVEKDIYMGQDQVTHGVTLYFCCII